MKERPILFSGEMVRAILDGRKTQTRRVVKPQPGPHIDELHGGELRKRAPYQLECYESGNLIGFGFQDDYRVYRCPYGEPGGRLWCRSGWSVAYNEARHEAWWCGPERTGLSFTTHGKPVKPKRLGNQPSIHMPRWVAQVLRLPELEITGVRVERVQEISEADAIAEGAAFHDGRGVGHSGWRHDFGDVYDDARSSFARLWDSINAKRGYGWSANPWVWVVEFKRIGGAT